MQTNTQKKQESHSLPALDNTWNPQIVLQTTKSTGPTSEPSSEAGSTFITEESVHKFLEIGSRVVITTATAWWTICELLDYLKIRSVEAKMAKEKDTGFESATPTDEVPNNESGI